MLASHPHPEAGQQLKAARLRAHLSTRDVERLSRAIAAEVNNQDCCISHAWITHVENGEFRPGIYKLYTLARIYKLKPDEVLSFFGLSLHDVERGYMSLNLPRTHLVGPVHEQPGQTIMAPLALRSTFRLEQTNLISRMFDNWGEIPLDCCSRSIYAIPFLGTSAWKTAQCIRGFGRGPWFKSTRVRKP